MSESIFTAQKFYVGGYDYAGISHALAVNRGHDGQDDTVMGDATKSNVATLETVGFSYQGFWDTVLDKITHDTNLGLADNPVTIGAVTGADGELAYILRVIEGQYNIGAKCGDLLPFSVSGSANKLVRGLMMHNATRTSTSTGVIRQLGVLSNGGTSGAGCVINTTVDSGGTVVTAAVGASGGATYAVGDTLIITGGNSNAKIRVATLTGGAVATVSIVNGGNAYTAGNNQATTAAPTSAGRMFAAFHVLSASGTNPTLDVIVESDDAQAFTTPVSRLTFAQKTAIGSQWTELAAPVTDDWWRVKWTIGGTNTPAFNFVVAIGIKP